ncbi:hypothetical protein EAF00_001624 [Botryotinia globosa]|nr:hypothetical protein EAF00_001624 [Botryotinia globosa]
MASSSVLYTEDSSSRTSENPQLVGGSATETTPMVADIQTAIVEEFDEVGKLTWVSVAFMLGVAGTNLMWGKAYSKITFDAKYVYIFTTLIFEVGSAICGGAPNMNALIVGRAIYGLGGIGMYIGVMTVMSENSSKTERPVYLGLIGILWDIGTVVGPFIGGAFADNSAT